MSGVLPGYALVWMLLFASGLGVAMFHPAAGKAARYAAMEGAGEVRGASAMSIFATGGNVGFFLAPVLAAPSWAAGSPTGSGSPGRSWWATWRPSPP